MVIVTLPVPMMHCLKKIHYTQASLKPKATSNTKTVKARKTTVTVSLTQKKK